MRWLCLLMILAADPSGVPGNFARPKGEAPPTEKQTRPWQRQDGEKDEASPQVPEAPREDHLDTLAPPPEVVPKEPDVAPEPPRKPGNFARPKTEAPPTEKPVREAPREPVGEAADGGLSDFFGAPLRPGDYAGIITALSDRLNRQTLCGVSPGQEFDRYERAAEQARGDGKVVRAVVDRLYRNMIDYLDMEAEFSTKASDGVLRRMAKLVSDQVELDPNVPQERGEQITQIMQANRQFPPASIVFGVQLFPYRPVKLPAGTVILEVPVEPQYVDEEKRAQASFDFMSTPGPVCRLDFEAARVGELAVEASHNRSQYVPVETVKKMEAGGVQGPLLLKEPVRTRYLRVTGAGQTEPPMLRNVHASALKGPAVAKVFTAPSPPELDASFKEAAYPRHAEVVGFVDLSAPRFAPESCEVRLCHTKDALVIGAYVRDSRMKTVVAQATERDADLEGEESFEMRIRGAKGEVFRFVVNPLGTQFDSRGGDAGWDAPWQAVTKGYSTGWAAEIAIPYAALGIQPRTGQTMQANFLRHRRNVTNEESAWAVAEGQPAWGTLTFE